MPPAGELEQIQFLLFLGNVSVHTTERYIGCKQRFRVALNDMLGIEPGSVAMDNYCAPSRLFGEVQSRRSVFTAP